MTKTKLLISYMVNVLGYSIVDIKNNTFSELWIMLSKSEKNECKNFNGIYGWNN